MVLDMNVTLATPQSLLFSSQATSLKVHSSEGELQILPGHQDLICTLEIAEVEIERADGVIELFFTHGGLLHVKNKNVEISCPAAQEVTVAKKGQPGLVTPQFVQQKRQQIQDAITKALESAGHYEPTVSEVYLLAEERLAKYQWYKEISK